MGLTVTQAANDLLSKLGIEGSDPTQAPALAQQDVVIALNQAGQIIQRAGQDYFTRSKQTITLSAGTAMYALPQTVQAILGPLRLNNAVPMSALLSRGELDQFDRIFLGSASYGAAQGVPIAYWPEYLSNGNTAGDIEQINIYFAPVPGSNPGFVVAEVVDAWVPLTLATGTALLPVAKEYAESILLPIARKFITRSSQFSRQDLKEQLEADGDAALASLGTAGGFPDAQQPEPARAVHG